MRTTLGFLAATAMSTPAFAGIIDIASPPLGDFVNFSGGGASASGGDETSIGGHTAITGARRRHRLAPPRHLTAAA